MLLVGETLKECRELKGISLGQLANESGLNKSFLSKIENNKRDPSLTSLSTVCEAIGIPLSIFILLAERTENDDFSEISELLKITARKAISDNQRI
jgi:transcriptional regulator with XRE-family HTH domain